MYPIDHDLNRKSAQKRVGNRERRSEAEHRLYWSTYRRAALRQALAPGKIHKIWMASHQLLKILRDWWVEHFPLVRGFNEQGSPTHPTTHE
jgi:hypothetical protein